MAQAQHRAISYDEIMADPLFKAGYEEIWRGEGSAVDIRWSDEEQIAYERGRNFGVFVKCQDGVRVPLSRGFLAHPYAKTLLLRAMFMGEVQ